MTLKHSLKETGKGHIQRFGGDGNKTEKHLGAKSEDKLNAAEDSQLGLKEWTSTLQYVEDLGSTSTVAR